MSNDGGILRPCSSTRNSAKSPVLARSAGLIPINWTCRVIGWPWNDHFIRAKVSIVGAIATTSSPATVLIRAITSSELRNPSKSRDSTITSARTPWSRSRIFAENPAITEFTTIIVATPSITLTTLASAIQRVLRYRQQSRYLYMDGSILGIVESGRSAEAPTDRTLPTTTARGRKSGNKITSRMLALFRSSMQSRSIPDAQAAGRGHGVLEGPDEVVVHLGHRVLGLLAGELGPEELFLESGSVSSV